MLFLRLKLGKELLLVFKFVFWRFKEAAVVQILVRAIIYVKV